MLFLWKFLANFCHLKLLLERNKSRPNPFFSWSTGNPFNTLLPPKVACWLEHCNTNNSNNIDLIPLMCNCFLIIVSSMFSDALVFIYKLPWAPSGKKVGYYYSHVFYLVWILVFSWNEPHFILFRKHWLKERIWLVAARGKRRGSPNTMLRFCSQSPALFLYFSEGLCLKQDSWMEGGKPRAVTPAEMQVCRGEFCWFSSSRRVLNDLVASKAQVWQTCLPLIRCWLAEGKTKAVDHAETKGLFRHANCRESYSMEPKQGHLPWSRLYRPHTIGVCLQQGSPQQMCPHHMWPSLLSLPTWLLFVWFACPN